ncbi:MAG: hypothetical protein JW757_03795 [Anaerolineales bacterium]|nr:hypothetical protein [Anaerolineales bacterium]
MFTSGKDEERIIPRKRMNYLKVSAQLLAVVFVLLYFGFDLLSEVLPAFPQLSYEVMLVILLVLVFVIPGGIALFSKWLQRQKWLALADEIGFQAKQTNRFSMPALYGSLRGHRITIAQTSERRGRSRVFFTKYQIMLNKTVDQSFVLKKRGIADFNQKKVGDDEFDKHYSTQATDERLIGNILRTRRLRLGLLQLGERTRTRSLTLNQDTLVYIESGETSDTEYLRAVMGFLSELAHNIERQGQFNFQLDPK